MKWSPETLLALLIIALFLKDSLLLLDSNEAVMVRRLGGRWRAGFGTKSWRLAGREPYLANPFLPHEPVLRLTWQMAGAPLSESARTRTFAEVPVELMRLGVFAWITWFELFVLIPTTLLGHVSGLTTLIAIAALYLNIVASLVAAWRWRQPLGLRGRTFAILAFECVACAPYAANLVRRVTALRSVNEDFTAAAQRLLDLEQMNEVKMECLARIDERIELVATDGEAMSRLQKARSRFAAADSNEPE